MGLPERPEHCLAAGRLAILAACAGRLAILAADR